MNEETRKLITQIEYAIEKGDGGADTIDTRKLIAIIREQAAEIEPLRKAEVERLQSESSVVWGIEMTAPIILVCGNREWTCKRTIRHWMARAQSLTGNFYPCTLIHGAAKGADLLAAEIAQEWGWLIEPYPADWATHGNAAGPIRNREMANTRPDIGLAFGKLYRGPKLTGTGDMVSVLNARGIPVIVIGEPIK